MMSPHPISARSQSVAGKLGPIWRYDVYWIYFDGGKVKGCKADLSRIEKLRATFPKLVSRSVLPNETTTA